MPESKDGKVPEEKKPCGKRMILRRLFCGPCVAEIVISFLGLVASLVPSVVYTYPFWARKAYVDKELFSNDAPGLIVMQIDSGSPLALAGMRPHDRVISFNGKPVSFSSFRELLAKIEPGEAITIDVKRDGKDVRLEYKGETPKLEGVLFFDWQFVSCAGLSCAASLACGHATAHACAAVAGDNRYSRRVGDCDRHDRDRGRAIGAVVVGLGSEAD